MQSTDIYMEANIFQQDFLYYCDALVNTHPNVFLNYPEDKFETNKKNALDILSHCNNEEEFSMILQQFIAPIKDTHTKVTNIWFPGEKRYPIRYKFYGDSLYILNMTNQLPTEFYGTILYSINGFSLEDIKMKAAQYTSYENEVGLKNNINLSIYKSDFLRTLGIIKNETDSITIETTGKRKWTIHPNSNSNWQIKFISHPITEKKKANFDYQILKDDKICYLQLNKFIDKRIAEWTYSSAVMLATTIKDNKLFTIVGEPTSQRPSHFGELLFLKLPNTKIVCNISCKQFHRPDREKDNEDTLFPDVIIMKTFKSLDEGKDLAFDWIISHINNN